MKNIKFLFFGIVAFSLSCTNEQEVQNDELSFTDVEKLFYMKTSFSEVTKSAIIGKYSSVENYYNYGIQRKKELVNLNLINKTKSSSRTSSYTWYRVRLTNPAYDLNTTISVRWDDYILNSALEQGIDLPYSCACGAEPSSVAKQLGGLPADQAEQTFLNDDEIEAGWVLLDVALPRSDCSFLTHQEENLY